MKFEQNAACNGTDTNLFFDAYEQSPDVRPAVERTCMMCPVQRECFATGVSRNEWGVWGGVYLKDGEPSIEMSSHRSSGDWAELWESLTMESNVHR
jgi:hypothetical protein